MKKGSTKDFRDYVAFARQHKIEITWENDTLKVADHNGEVAEIKIKKEGSNIIPITLDMIIIESGNKKVTIDYIVNLMGEEPPIELINVIEEIDGIEKIVTNNTYIKQ